MGHSSHLSQLKGGGALALSIEYSSGGNNTKFWFISTTSRDQGVTKLVQTEEQLNILKTCYSANPRPDALMKEQLVEMTTLSPRVIRVWFQNKRCKDKKIQQRMQEKQMQRECVSLIHISDKNRQF